MSRFTSGNRAESILLAVLFGGFALFGLLLERHAEELTAPTTTSSFNAAPAGLEAVFLLLNRVGAHPERLEGPYQALANERGLLVVVEPLIRTLGPGELEACAHWVYSGNTVMYVLAPPSRPLDPRDSMFGDLTVDEYEVQPATISVHGDGILRDISKLTLTNNLRIGTAAKDAWKIDAKTDDGAVVAERTFGRGHLIVVGGITPANSTIASGDNILLFANAADLFAHRPGDHVLFDEYHHGVGFEAVTGDSERSAYSYAPLWLKLVFLHLLAFGIVLLYNTNRTFGLRILPAPPRSSNRSQFVTALADLFKRKRAIDAALMVLYRQFERELRREMSAPDSEAIESVVKRAASRMQIDAAEFSSTLEQCRRAAAGENIGEPAAIALANRLRELRGRCAFVRHSG